MYFKVYLAGDRTYAQKISDSSHSRDFPPLVTNASRYRHAKSEMSFLFLRVRNSLLTLEGLFCCHFTG